MEEETKRKPGGQPGPRPRKIYFRPSKATHTRGYDTWLRSDVIYKGGRQRP